MVETIGDGGGLVGRIVLCTVIAYVIIYFSMWKGLGSSTKLAYVTVPAPYILLFILLIKGLTLEGAGSGLSFLLKPDFSKLSDFSIWQAAL
jgi:SNF family Na+-dependent transporter